MGQLKQCIVAATCWLICLPAWGQGYPNQYAAPIEQPPMVDPQLLPAGFHHQQPWGYQRQACPPDQQTMWELLPDDRGFLYDHDSRLDLTIKEVLRGTWFSIEYLNFRVSIPEDDLIGSRTTLTDNPTAPFDVTFNDPLNPIPATGLGVVEHLGDISWNNINGIRGKFGIPITKAMWIEGTAWGLQENIDSLPVPILQQPQLGTPVGGEPIQFIVLPLLTDGAVGTRFVLYDDSFFANYSTQVWSGDVNLAFNLLNPTEGWSLQPLMGFKHVEYAENLTFGGTYTNRSGFDVVNPAILVPGSSNLVNSKVANYQYGFQFGLRSEMRSRFLTLGVEPKVTLGSNSSRATVTTQDLREPGDVTLLINDPTVTTSSRDTVFTPTVDVGVYAKLKVREWLNFKIGYNVLWLGNVSTASSNIFYNDTGDANPPGVVVRTQYGNRLIDGLTIGGEILLP